MGQRHLDLTRKLNNDNMCIISKNWEVCLSKQKKKLKLGGCNRGITSGAPLISHMLSDISILPPCNGGCKCVNSKN
jgi:hypothetical protein